MTDKEARAAGYSVTKGHPVGSARPAWGIVTNVNHPSGRSGKWVGGHYRTRREALEEVGYRVDLMRGEAVA